MKRVVFVVIGIGMALSLAAQDKLMSMEEAVVGYHLRPQSKSLLWQGKSHNYTYVDGAVLMGEDAATGEKREIMTAGDLNRILGVELRGFPPFSWLDENTLRIQRPGKSYRVDVVSKALVSESSFPADAANITCSPQGTCYAYTLDNNLYYMDATGRSVAVTADNDPAKVNGQTVSRNEFGIEGGIFWSPDGKKLAFYQKDESRVSTFPLLDITTRTGSLKEIKYPMAGMPSEEVKLGVYDVASGNTAFLDVTDFDQERYLTNITWSPQSDLLYVQVLNRGQDHLKLNTYNAFTGEHIATLFEEKAKTYVEPQHPIVFTDESGKRFIFTTNNRDGYFSLYLHDASGKLIKRLTPVNADVRFVAIDPAGKYIYYTSSEVSPVEMHLFRVELKNGKRTRLTGEKGWHSVALSGDCSYFLDNYSSMEVPRIIQVADNTGKVARQLLAAEDPLAGYATGEVTLGTIKADDGEELYYRLIKPVHFDPAKKYPVIHYVYGGPHLQLVTDSWNSLRMWEMYMAQQGYVVFVMDNHGTPNRGKAFEEVIHRQCGQQEMLDQVKGITWLKSHPWVNANRIGVHGWSYGGFMTITLITNYPDIYKVGVAGGPVIDWKWYEVMYGERYMDTPEENPEGYEKTSLIHKAKELKGKLLICQGMVDPVVVVEHSFSFIRECIKNNVQVDYFPYPCAEHNVMGRDRIHLMQKVTNYFEDYL